MPAPSEARLMRPALVAGADLDVMAARAVGVPMRAATKPTLAAAHLIAGAIIIPVVARRLSRPR